MQAPTSEWRPRLRLDLEWVQAAADRIVVRDPLNGNFFRLREHESFAASLMRGGLSLSEIENQLRDKYPGALLDARWLTNLAQRLKQHQLLVEPAKAASASWGSRLGRTLANPLAIRIPLFDPSPWIHLLIRPAHLLLHPLAVAAWLTVFFLVSFAVLRQLLDDSGMLERELLLIQGDRLVVLLLCYLFAKSMHEMGHAVAAAYHGSKCHEVGLLILCFTPCLYCDTTDSWRLASKWKRAGIALAGLYVELIVASLAGVVWLASSNNLIHYLSGNLMFVCSIGSVLININPLLKYDGYFVLSDLVDVPNLASQSGQAARLFWRRVVAGEKFPNIQFDIAYPWLLLYASLSFCYRIMLLSLILWFIWYSLVPMGLGLIAIVISSTVAGGWIVLQLQNIRHILRGIRGTWKLLRSSLVIAAMTAAIGWLFLYPFPAYIEGPAVTEFQDAVPLYATRDAELQFTATHGQQLMKGEPLFTLTSAASDFELHTRQCEIDELELQLDEKLRAQSSDQSAAFQVPVLRERLRDLRHMNRLLAQEISRLHVTAPFDGFILTSNAAPILKRFSIDQESSRDRIELSDKLLGANVQRGDLLGWFTAARQPYLAALINESDVRRLEVGAETLIQWDAYPTQVFKGRIVSISPEAAKATPEELVGDRRLISVRHETGTLKPEKPHFELRIEIQEDLSDSWTLPHSTAKLPRGSVARVQIEIPAQSLLHRLSDWLTKTWRPAY